MWTHSSRIVSFPALNLRIHERRAQPLDECLQKFVFKFQIRIRPQLREGAPPPVVQSGQGDYKTPQRRSYFRACVYCLDDLRVEKSRKLSKPVDEEVLER